MTKIDTKAKNTYFASEAKKAIGISIYTGWYKQGYLQALSDVREVINSQPNNKARLMEVINLIEFYYREEKREEKRENGNEGD